MDDEGGYLLIVGDPDFLEELRAAAADGLPDNPDVLVEEVQAKRGDPLSIAIAIIGFISSIAGLIQFFDFGIGKVRDRRRDRRPITWSLVLADGTKVDLTVEPDDTAAQIQDKLAKLTAALEA